MELSPAEKIAKVGAEREIVHTNTRFTANPFNLEKHKETISEAASVKARRLHGKIGPDGKEILPAEAPKVGGYGFVATPSINPGMKNYLVLLHMEHSSHVGIIHNIIF